MGKETPVSPHVRSIAMALILTVLTFGLFNLWVQHKQMQAVNAMLGEKRYSFLLWALFTAVSFGLYHIYHEYRISTDIARKLSEAPGQEGLRSVILTCLGLWIVEDAIQQSQINRYFGAHQL